MTEAEDFSHGSYGDYSGVVFYGPPTEGFWLDRLAVSDRYITPLFSAVLDRSQAVGGKHAPQLVRDWAALQGWAAGDGAVELPRPAVEELPAALGGITAADVSPYGAGATPDECLRCSGVVRRFLAERLARGVGLFIESE